MIGNTTSEFQSTANSSHTFSHNNDGNCLYVAIAFDSSSAFTFADVTFNGSSMTLVGSVETGRSVYVYRLLSPSSGEHSVLVDYDGTNNNVCYLAVSVSGVDLISPETDVQTIGGTGGSISIPSIDSTINDLVIAFSYLNNGEIADVTEGADQSLVGSVGNNGVLWSSEKQGSAGSQSLSWTVASESYGSVGISISLQSSETLTITEGSAGYGDEVTLNTSITSATSASGSDGTTTIALTDFAGSAGSFTANLPAIPVGSDGWEPGATITITITDGTDTATDTIALDAPDGFSTVTATTQESGLIAGNWGFVGASGLDSAVVAGDKSWSDYDGDNPDGTTDEPVTLPLTVTRYLWRAETSELSSLTLTYPADGGEPEPEPEPTPQPEISRRMISIRAKGISAIMGGFRRISRFN